MVAEAEAANSISGESGRAGDVPDAIRRRYLLDERGGPGLGFYVDARMRVAAFRDQGRLLATPRSDPNAIRDMTAIARYRGWAVVVARGSAEFRREAWFAGRAAGLQVRGYRPSERDAQELDRRTARDRYRSPAVGGKVMRGVVMRTPPGAQSRLALVEEVVRARIVSTEAQERIMASARRRVASWLERGADFQPLDLSGVQHNRGGVQRRERQR